MSFMAPASARRFRSAMLPFACAWLLAVVKAGAPTAAAYSALALLAFCLTAPLSPRAMADDAGRAETQKAIIPAQPGPPAAADDLAAGRKVLQKAIIAAFPRPSLDIYPVEFSVGRIRYRVPRNYLTTMEDWNGGPQAVVTLRVNLPDLKPYSKETFNCFTAKPLDRPPACEPFSFRINGPDGPSPTEVFERVRGLFHSQVAIEGPYGFEKYEVGPDNARIEYYRKAGDDQSAFYSCIIFDNHGRRDGLCSPVSDRVATSGTLKFFFNLTHLKGITQIDANLRQLVLGFTVKAGSEN